MSGHDKNNQVYSARDIQKYLMGELSAPEMHRLEMAALEDPMLSDALEGMEVYHAGEEGASLRDGGSVEEEASPWEEGSVEEESSSREGGSVEQEATLQGKASLRKELLRRDLEDLQERLERRVNKRERRGGVLFLRSTWGVAAAVVLLVGLGLSAYYFFLTTGKSGQPKVVARSEPSVPAPVQSDSVARTERAATLERGATGVHADQAAPRADRVGADRTAKLRKDATGVRAVPAAAMGSKAADSIQHDMAAVTDKSFRDAASSKKEEASVKEGGRTDNSADVELRASRVRVDTNRVAQLVFTGKVIDQNKNPLPGAALSLAGNDAHPINVITDKNGFFSLRVPRKDSALTLTVASVGYVAASLDLVESNRTGNIIQLQPQSTALNEVVVSGYGAKRKEVIRDNRKPEKEYLNTKAIPGEGWPAYQEYIELHKKIMNPDSTTKGNETISFLVNREGVLSSFKVEQSLSPAHDSAAIQLIREGPPWKLLKGRKTRAWVTIAF